MNIYLIIAGVLGIIGGLAHTFLGHKWTVNSIVSENLKPIKNTGDQDKRFLTWFWHIGSVVLLSTSSILLMEGLNQIDIHRDLQLFISFIWISMSGIFLVVASYPPVQIFKMIPGLFGIVINVFILLGLYA